jgi:hypothetical protein
MPRKPIELPPEVARRFVQDMRAFHTEKNQIKRDEIVKPDRKILPIAVVAVFFRAAPNSVAPLKMRKSSLAAAIHGTHSAH